LDTASPRRIPRHIGCERDSAEVPIHLVRASFNGTPAFDLVEQIVGLTEQGPAKI
jgi:hypothetical protein